ncbi:hypothetical protein AVEN_134822-1 [Araneus ventricosus]|uniref:Uncharacterized protein n=1 Tax=Araneus ventricosus TaxID=182803 RepID=A0A4Y2JD38_ARAVE|nr:hypothetical protein AVEN_134822-1 [Araneus ventricosus]
MLKKVDLFLVVSTSDRSCLNSWETSERGFRSDVKPMSKAKTNELEIREVPSIKINIFFYTIEYVLMERMTKVWESGFCPLFFGYFQFILAFPEPRVEIRGAVKKTRKDFG